MKKKDILLLIFSSLFLLNCLAETPALAKHPAREIMELYEGELEGMNTIEPYMVGILALNELEHKRHYQEVKRFILWHFSKLNYPDRHGLTGTIYDYVLDGKRERSTNNYDSVDGYSGLFLHLLHQYVVETGNVDILRDNWNKIEDIAYTIPFLQEKDGLTRALPDSQVKYLMDNCESYGGISSYLALRTLVGKENSAYYSGIQRSIKKGIAHLYDSKTAMFAWAVEDGYQSLSSWNIYYPDSYAQIFLIYYDLLDDKPEMQAAIWNTFCAKYGGAAHTFPIEQRIIYELTKTKMARVRGN